MFKSSGELSGLIRRLVITPRPILRSSVSRFSVPALPLIELTMPSISIDLRKISIFDNFIETLANPTNRPFVQLETPDIILALDWILQNAPQLFIQLTDTETRIFAFKRKKVLLLFVRVGQVES